MRWLIVAAALVAVLPLLADTKDSSRTFTFTKDDLGKAPKGWKEEQTGKGKGSVWKVVADKTAPSKTGYVLAQTAEGPEHFFNMCVVQDTSCTDLELSVAFKAIKGKEDQGGGVVWRYTDHDNYYICRMNPLEDNFRVYKVVGGRRMMLATTKNDVKAPANAWHSLSIRMKGEQIECSLDGKKLLTASDATFKKAGKIGLWSKADAQSHFDNLTVKGK